MNNKFMRFGSATALVLVGGLVLSACAANEPTTEQPTESTLAGNLVGAGSSAVGAAQETYGPGVDPVLVRRQVGGFVVLVKQDYERMTTIGSVVGTSEPPSGSTVTPTASPACISPSSTCHDVNSGAGREIFFAGSSDVAGTLISWHASEIAAINALD